jgi:signal transduction histidine kinase
MPVFVSVAEMLAGELLTGAATGDRVAGLVREAATTTGLPENAAARGVYTLLIRDPRLASAEPGAALEAHLTALLRFAPITHASLWLTNPSGELCVAKVGERVHARRLRATAREAVANGPGPSGPESALRALSVTRLDSSMGALVVQVKRGRVRRALDYAAEAAGFLAPVVERQLLLGQVLESGGQLLETAERRIARFGFDIHDGPLQDLSVLSGELSAFQRELQAVVQDEDVCRIVERRVAHVAQIVTGLERELRDLAIAAGRGVALPIREILEREAAHFERRTGIRTKLVVEGDVDRTTASQRIAVTRVVEEALANVREHARANHVEVAVRRDADAMRLCVVDDGRGFDVARAMRRAERNHRIGVAAMGERVRLLGGQLEVDSRPGGPTVISAVLPAWTPAAAS